METKVTSQKSVLKIRCSDGLTTKPSEIKGKIVHEIRLPGGILFPDFCTFVASSNSEQTSEMSFHFAIATAIAAIIDLKNPEQIILMAHTHCGAAMSMGLTEDSVMTRHYGWQKQLQKHYPSIPVRVLLEKHSACGTIREGHFELATNTPLKALPFVEIFEKLP